MAEPREEPSQIIVLQESGTASLFVESARLRRNFLLLVRFATRKANQIFEEPIYYMNVASESRLEPRLIIMCCLLCPVARLRFCRCHSKGAARLQRLHQLRTSAYLLDIAVTVAYSNPQLTDLARLVWITI